MGLRWGPSLRNSEWTSYRRRHLSLAVEGESVLGREVAKGILCRDLGLWDEGRLGCSAGRGSYVPET